MSHGTECSRAGAVAAAVDWSCGLSWECRGAAQPAEQLRGQGASQPGGQARSPASSWECGATADL